MKTDRELLELAAKAAGIPGSVYSFPGMLERYGFNEAIYDDAGDSHWNPLTDDGDALRLAIKLSLRVECYTGVKIIPKYGECNVTDVYSVRDEKIALSESHNGDPYAATRRAIVRAAAAIGEQMK